MLFVAVMRMASGARSGEEADERGRSGVRLAIEARSNARSPVSNAISGVVGAAFDSEQLMTWRWEQQPGRATWLVGECSAR